jgi:NLR family CARD domain-containing protein 3
MESLASQCLGDPAATRVRVRKMIEGGGTVDALTDIICSALGSLVSSGQNPLKSVVDKFMHEGSNFNMSYAGLDAFFGGLEGKLGAPNPELHETMRAEHSHRIDSNRRFTATNYGVETTSAKEWLFVDSPDEVSVHNTNGQPRWAVETKLEDPDHRRAPLPAERLHELMKEKNAQLENIHQAPLIKEEVLGSRLYTGPLFVKYNAVLRGLHCKNYNLIQQMLTLCGDDDPNVEQHDSNSGFYSASLTRIYVPLVAER